MNTTSGPDASTSLEGKKLGPYRLQTLLGVGGMGTVYLAQIEDPVRGLTTGSSVAVKILHPHLLAHPGVFKRFLREAELGKRISHPSVVQTIDVDAIELEGQIAHFLITEYVEGQTLRSLKQELERVPEELCRHIGREIAHALVAIHGGGIIHRDLKPENVLITDSNTVKVMDLGVARLAEQKLRLSATGAFVGSLLYSAPEQLTGEADAKTDLYSLGIVLFELATGKHPLALDDLAEGVFRMSPSFPTPSEFGSQLSPFFEEVLKSLTSSDSKQRFSSAADLVEALDADEKSEWWVARIRDLRSRKRSSRGIPVQRRTTLRGRENELATLDTAFERVEGGDGQVVIIRGEAGIGKTRLMHEFVSRLEAANKDFNWLYGGYPPGGGATADSAFCDAFRGHFGEFESLDSLQHQSSMTPPLISAFEALQRGEAAISRSSQLGMDTIQTVFVRATHALAGEKPTVLLIDDLQFTPSHGRALFASIAMAVPEHRVLLIGSSRRGLPTRWLANLERLEQTSVLSLDRLRAQETTRLVEDALGSSANLTPRELHEVVARSDGNPLFALEIATSMSGMGSRDPARGGEAERKVSLRIPKTVADLIAAKIADLDEEEKDVLEVAACCGHRFDPSVVADVLGVGRIPILKQLGRIENTNRLVLAEGMRFVFDHPQVHTVLYEGLSGSLRREYHAAIGQSLEQQIRSSGGDAQPDRSLAADACRHLMLGGQVQRARPHLTRALEHLEQAHLYEAGCDLAHRAMLVPGMVDREERLALVMFRLRCLDILGEHLEERKVLEEATELADDSGDAGIRSQVRRAFGAYFIRVSNYAGAREKLTQAVEIARRHGRRSEEAVATNNMGLLFASLGLFELARSNHERALTLQQKIGDTKGEARTITNLESVCVKLGLYEDARLHIDRALSLCRAVGYRRGEARAITNLGAALARAGQHETARDKYEIARTLARDIGYRRGEARALHGLGIVDEAVGDTEPAERHYREALAMWTACGSRLGASNSGIAMGRLLMASGDVDGAIDRFDQASAIGAELGAPSIAVLGAAYRMLLPAGDVEIARARFTEHEQNLGQGSKMIAHLLFWRATGNPIDIEEAHRLLVCAREHAPKEWQQSMIENVPDHREIMEAWENVRADEQQCRRARSETNQKDQDLGESK